MPPKGYHLTAEQIEKLRIRSTINNGMRGKHHTEETRAKMRESHKNRFGDKAPAWKGGRYISSDGRVIIFKPEHPYAHQGYVPEHRLIMEQIVGRFLTTNEIVHHINHIPSDNRPENLMLLSRGAHTTLHNNERELLPSANYGTLWMREKRRKQKLEDDK